MPRKSAAAAPAAAPKSRSSKPPAPKFPKSPPVAAARPPSSQYANSPALSLVAGMMSKAADSATSLMNSYVSAASKSPAHSYYHDLITRYGILDGFQPRPSAAPGALSSPSPASVDTKPSSYIDLNADQVRHKIRAFLDNGGMKVTDFIHALDTNGPTYYRFMKQSGPDRGIRSDVYVAAYNFFKEREQNGLAVPRKKPANSVAAAAAAAGDKGKGKRKRGPDDAQPGNQPKKSRGQPKNATQFDLSGIRLDGEDEDAVEVYDTCDDVRRKISNHLRRAGVTKASFLRDLQAQFHKTPRTLQAMQLERFRDKRGADGGNTSGIFYAAYVFFEKLRIKENKPKSEHRLKMERIWSHRGGFETKKVTSNQSFFGPRDMEVWQDEFGRYRTSLMRGSPPIGASP